MIVRDAYHAVNGWSEYLSSGEAYGLVVVMGEGIS